jgi:hypothetical protein
MASGMTETMQENIQHCLSLEEGNPEFKLLTGEEIAAETFFYLFS